MIGQPKRQAGGETAMWSVTTAGGGGVVAMVRMMIVVMTVMMVVVQATVDQLLSVAKVHYKKEGGQA